MKYTRYQFTNEFYSLWQMGLFLPRPKKPSVYSVKYRKNQFDEYSRVTLEANSVSDALERACFAVAQSSLFQPEEIDLHAVYDIEDNLLWIDESFYEIIQKKKEFRGLERREFLLKFASSSAAILFGLRPLIAHAGTVTLSLSGTASGFGPLSGEQLYTTAGSYSWTVPSQVTSVSVVCIGGGASGGGNGSSSGTSVTGASGGQSSIFGLAANGGAGGVGGSSSSVAGGSGGSSSGGNSNFYGGNGAAGTGASLYGTTGGGSTYGSGGGGYPDHFGGAGGGGAGGLCFKNSISVTAGSSNSLVVGTGRGLGASGAIRIMWGNGRSFPSNAA